MIRIVVDFLNVSAIAASLMQCPHGDINPATSGTQLYAHLNRYHVQLNNNHYNCTCRPTCKCSTCTKCFQGKWEL